MAAGASLLFCGAAVQAQTVDALLDKLVDKGVLSVKEANQLREESDKNFTTAHASKTGMPDWVTALKIYGDFRGRFEGFYGQDAVVYERNRFRYRARVGLTATLKDQLELGIRLTSDEANSSPANSGGDPLSGNTTFNNNASKKFLYIDQAYGKWTPQGTGPIQASLTIGKMESPYVFSDMVFDSDYTPEGAAIKLGYNISDNHALSVVGGAFVLNELGASIQTNAYYMAVQGRYDAKWSSKVMSSVGVGTVLLENKNSLTPASIPLGNSGNHHRADGSPEYEINPIIVDASVTYTLASFPLYNGAFPIKLGGEYMVNPCAPDGIDKNNAAGYQVVNNYAWSAGIQFGKSGKKGTWDVSYVYKWLGSDAQWDQFVDSDFGACYQGYSDPTGNAARKNGYRPGTNVKGSIVKVSWSPYDALTLSGKVFFTDLIDPVANSAGNSASGMTRMQLDAMLKF